MSDDWDPEVEAKKLAARLGASGTSSMLAIADALNATFRAGWEAGMRHAAEVLAQEAPKLIAKRIAET